MYFEVAHGLYCAGTTTISLSAPKKTGMTDPTIELTVADVMQVVVKTVSSGLAVPELEQELLRAKVSGFPVVDDLNLVGVVSRSDIIRKICDEREVAQETSDFYFDETGFHESKMESLKDIADRVGERLESLTVRDVMASKPKTVRSDQKLSEAANMFVDNRIHRLPVVEGRGRTLVGIVTTMDLVRLIGHRKLRSHH
jgi:CBS domain-containing protein